MNIWRDEQRDAEPSLVRLRSASCLTLASGATCPSRHVASTARSTLRILLRAFDLARDALQRIALALGLTPVASAFGGRLRDADGCGTLSARRPCCNSSRSGSHRLRSLASRPSPQRRGTACPSAQLRSVRYR